jgi:hypothetical protein
MFSFERDKRRVELQAFARRISDLTAPNLPPMEGTNRCEDRYNRTLPILVTPWQDGRPSGDDLEYGTTRDLSDHGFSLVMSHPPQADEILLALWLCSAHQDRPESDPFLVRGQVRQCADFGAGFWLWGVELVEVVKTRRLVELLRSAALRLLPHALRSDAQSACYTPQVC